MAVTSHTPPPNIADIAQKHNQGQVRADDYSIIGAALGMLLSPAIFLKRANIVTLVAGGAAIGLGGGVWAHLAKSLTKGEEVKPEAMVSTVLACCVRARGEHTGVHRRRGRRVAKGEGKRTSMDSH